MPSFYNMLMENQFPLVMSLPFNKPSLAKAAWESGADVVKIHLNVHHHASSTLFHSFDEEASALQEILVQAQGPVGVVIGGDIPSVLQDYKKVQAAGFDFCSIYGHFAPIEVLQLQGLHKMIAPDYTWQDWEIAEMKAMGVDILEASVMHPDSYGMPLSLRDFIHYKHLSQVAQLPMLIPTQRAIRPKEVADLAQCGAKGIMLGAVVTGKEEQSIRNAIIEFRQAINAMQGTL